MRIAVFNDTGSINHVGCQAVTQAHSKQLKKFEVAYKHQVSAFIQLTRLTEGQQTAALKRNKELMSQLESVEAIVINGEGTLHHNRGSEYLALAKVAKEMGKKVYLLNALFQDMTYHLDVLNELDDITVREKYSFNYLTNLGVKNHRMVLDSIIDADFANTGNFDFGNQIVFTDFHHERQDVGQGMRGVYNTIAKTYGGYTPTVFPLAYDAAKHTWQHAVQNLRSARLVVTGRHHGVYLAGLAGVPFVACPGNSWKIESLIKTSGLPIPVCTTTEEIYHGIHFAQADENKHFFAKFSAFLYKEKGLKTFDKLNEALNASKSSN